MKMDEKMMAFLDELKLHLKDLPEAEKTAALNYYEDLLNDASYDGVSPEDMLSKLDTPANIAASIKAEVSIKNVSSKPDLKNYSKAVKYSRSRITRPLSLFLFSMLIFATYSIAICLFIITVASTAAACITLSVFVSEALKIPSQYMAEIISSIGIGIFFAGLLLLNAYCFFKLTGLLVKLSTRLIARMLKNNTSQSPDDGSNCSDEKDNVADISITDGANLVDTENDSGSDKRAGLKKLALRIVMAVSAAGLVISLLTGLPIRLFMLYNSVAPSNIELREWEFSSDDTSKISINTAHTNIRLKKGSSDEIEIKYEKADWLEPEISCTGGQLEFREKPNGRMPLFRLVTLHENGAELTISLPDGFNPDELKLESRGGFIYIDSVEYPVEAKTYTGAIHVESFGDMESAAVRARTSAGFIQAAGQKAGTKTADSTVYQSKLKSKALIQIETERGNIFID